MLEHRVVNVGVHALVLVCLAHLFHVLALDVSHRVIVRFVRNRQVIQAGRMHNQVIYEIDPLPIVVLLLFQANARLTLILVRDWMKWSALILIFLNATSIGHRSTFTH